MSVKWFRSFVLVVLAAIPLSCGDSETSDGQGQNASPLTSPQATYAATSVSGPNTPRTISAAGDITAAVNQYRGLLGENNGGAPELFVLEHAVDRRQALEAVGPGVIVTFGRLRADAPFESPFGLAQAER